jgi:hypothetical protein
LLAAAPLLVLAVGAPIAQAIASASWARFDTAPRSGRARLQRRVLTAALHLLQPLARLHGRWRHGLTPWRWNHGAGLAVPRTRRWSAWREQGPSADERLRAIRAELAALHFPVLSGGAYDRWDLQARGGLMGYARLLMAVEDLGGGAQLIRVRAWPRCGAAGLVMILACAALAIGAAADDAWGTGIVVGVLAALLALRAALECSSATAALVRAIDRRGLS